MNPSTLCTFGDFATLNKFEFFLNAYKINMNFELF